MYVAVLYVQPSPASAARPDAGKHPASGCESRRGGGEEFTPPRRRSALSASPVNTSVMHLCVDEIGRPRERRTSSGGGAVTRRRGTLGDSDIRSRRGAGRLCGQSHPARLRSSPFGDADLPGPRVAPRRRAASEVGHLLHDVTRYRFGQERPAAPPAVQQPVERGDVVVREVVVREIGRGSCGIPGCVGPPDIVTSVGSSGRQAVECESRPRRDALGGAGSVHRRHRG
jgi:hypothetical protein